ncbi:MAG: TIGR03087 family PEP-CTERM/XrtA system glycosyltransferase [Nitrospirales bacterium]|nr:TIGR03087 family PEP-CTERM/XrtA system glycosyltransferase [Nitrospirales bacterium]
MKILFLSHRVPFPPDRGDRIRSFNFIKALSVRHEIHLMSLSFEKDSDSSAREILRKYCTSVEIFPVSYALNSMKSAFYLFSDTPLTVPLFHSGEMRKRVSQRLAREIFDLVFIYSSSMAPYAIDADNLPRIMDFIDVDSEKWLEYSKRSGWPMNWVYSREARCLRKFEVDIEKKCEASLFVSEDEASLFKTISRDARSISIGNGVDLSDSSEWMPRNERKDNIVFVGVMDYYPNVDGVIWFAQEVFPRIRERRPAAMLYIVGKNPSAAVKRLHDEQKGMTVTGYVSDVKSYLMKAGVSVIPLRIARGIQNKVLEAMASGVPVVSTANAMEGIGADNGVDFLMADNAEDFAQKTLQLMENNELAERIACNAFRFVSERFSWQKKANELDALMHSVAGAFKSASS